MFNAVIRNTIAVTMLTAGYKENVIPGAAEAMLDCRLAPGQSAQDVAREIEAISGPDIDIELELVMESPARTSSLDSPLYEAIQRGVSRHDPGAIVLPMLSAVATDGRFLSERGITYYGYCPLRLPEDFAFSELIHSHDERIPVDAFREGVQVLTETVLDFCCAHVT
jgi:acetylornithine deacetylase/succinyl-diaminopimelate desuccinylase-like protein